jgi:hypothetical protein
LRPVVIIATLGLEARPTLRDTLRCILNQTVPCEVITWSGGVNEYEARNEACRKALAGHSPEETVLIFVDDDTTPPPDYVERMTKHFEDPRVMAATCGLKGNFWGAGEMEVSMPYWAIGATLAVRGSAFLEMGGFEVDWGVRPPPRGWRGDSDIVWRIIDRYGYGSYVHDFSLKNIHPGMMGAVWQPAVEERFYLRHRSKVLRYIAPYDPRLRSFVVQRGLERDDRVVRLFTHDQAPRLEWVRREIHMLDYRLRGDVKILDVGGEDGFLFAGTGWDYTVMDIDLYDVPDGRFVRHDADTDWPFPDRSFDVVVLGEVLEHVERPDHVWGEACRVARHMVLATVPNEYEWSSDKAPLLTREERMRRDGFTDIDEMARSFASKSSHLLELTSEKVKPHLWHRRWFTRDELQRLVGDAEIGDIRFGGWAWWTVKKII